MAYERLQRDSDVEKTILFDVYSDGTSMSRLGGQSVNVMRVRFTNIRHYSNRWFNVGISPVLPQNLKVNAAQKKQMKRELFQRYVYLAFKDLMKASKFGESCDGKLLFPRLFMLVADQPQDRDFFH